MKQADREVAASLLQQMRSDPREWSSLDLHRLLDLHGFGSEELDTGTSWRAILRYHPDHPALNVVLTDEPEPHAAVTLHAVRIVQTILEMGEAEGTP